MINVRKIKCFVLIESELIALLTLIPENPPSV